MAQILSSSYCITLFLTCAMGKWSFLKNSNFGRRTVRSILLIKRFSGIVEITFGLVNASFSLPEWQAVKLTFFTSCQNVMRSIRVIYQEEHSSLPRRKTTTTTKKFSPQLGTKANQYQLRLHPWRGLQKTDNKLLQLAQRSWRPHQWRQSTLLQICNWGAMFLWWQILSHLYNSSYLTHIHAYC